MSDTSQQQKGGDHSVNMQANRDIHYHELAQRDENDFGVLDEIFKSVIQALCSGDYKVDKGHLNLKDKIKINFSSDSDQKRVQEYFRFAYTKVALIERRIQEEDVERQNDLHGHIFAKYHQLRDAGQSNIQTLEELFSHFILPGKSHNEQYTNLTRAFVLFFFDDCTIFDKTNNEH